MGTRRMISSDIWRDEYIGVLDMFSRLLWVGLIVTCADDQGRILNNPRLIRSDVFPLDDVPVEQVEQSIRLFAQARKIQTYEADGKKLIQIINWWEYQTPSWASSSKYPAPAGWVDREKYHTTGNKIVSNNWDRKGGYSELPSQLPSQLPSELDSSDVKGEVKGEVKGDVKGDVDVDVEGSDNDISLLGDAGKMQGWFVTASGLPLFGASDRMTQACQEIAGMRPTEEEIKTAVAETRARYGQDAVTGPWSIIKPLALVIARRGSTGTLPVYETITDDWGNIYKVSK